MMAERNTIIFFFRKQEFLDMSEARSLFLLAGHASAGNRCGPFAYVYIKSLKRVMSCRNMNTYMRKSTL